MAKRSKTLQGANLDLQEIEPLTKNQLRAFESEKNMVLLNSMIKFIHLNYQRFTVAMQLILDRLT